MKNSLEVDFVIFDLGNVIIDIFYPETLDYIKSKVAPTHQEKVATFYQTDFHKDYEKGLITSIAFRDQVRAYFEEDWSDEFVDFLWNYLLGKIPSDRLKLVEELKKKYQVGILSNTNEIHINAVNEILNRDHDIESLDRIFDHIYFSHHMNLAKPDSLIYQKMIADLNTTPERELFFDDLKNNVDGAKSLGIQAYQVTSPQVIFDFFKNV